MKLKITATRSKMGDEEFNRDDPILRYDFVISPLEKNSPVFRFMRYCATSDIDKTVNPNIRRLIAFDLRKKHRSCWERYHLWKEERKQ